MTDQILQAALSTMDTFVILPLIVFCFLPVYPDIKSSPVRLLGKITASFLVMEIVMFLIFLAWPDGTILNELLCIGFFFYLYQKEVCLKRSHLWFLFMTACLIGSFSFLSYSLADIFLHPSATINEGIHMDSSLVKLTFESALVLLLAYPARKYLGWLVHHFNEERVWRFIWLLPAGFMFFAFGFIPYNNSLMYQGRFLQMYLVTIPFLMILVFLIYVLFYLMARSFVEKQEILQKAAVLELQAKQYEQQQAHMRETSRLRHDFRHQLTVLAHMLQNQDYPGLEQYLRQYILTISDTSQTYCASPAANALLNHYAALGREQQIEVRFQVRLPETLPLSEIDLCVLLGNLLENAVDGCRSLPEKQRQIHLRIGLTSPQVIALQISNPCKAPLQTQDGTILSSKHDGRGQGLESVRAIVEKYHGYLELQPGPPSFEVRVLLNV